MAIKTATIQVRMGLESELDISKALPGEWLLSTDTKHIRMCVAYGIVLRMATYESFEADMAKIKELVSTAQSVKSIVMGLAAEVGEKTTIVLEATEEAKKYMEEAKKYSELAFATTPDGYEVLVKDVNLLKNSIVQTTSRTLYGSKAGGIKLIGVKGASEQAVYSGAQLLPPIIASGGNGVTLSYDEDGYMVLNGTATATSVFSQYFDSDLPIGTYTLSANNEKKASATIQCTISDSNLSVDIIRVNLNDADTTITKTTTEVGKRWAIIIPSGTVLDNYKLRPQLEVGEVATEYEPYVGNAPSPSPSYPQPIESVGDSGSLVIEQSGKNKLFPRRFISGMTISTNGTIVSDTRYGLRYVKVEGGKTYCLSRLMDTSGMNASLWGFTDSFPTIGNTCSYNPWYSNHATSPTITAPSDGYFVLRERIDGTYEAGTGFEVQFEEGTIRTEYVEDYSLITIPLSEPLRGIGDITDEVVCKNGVWGVERKIKSVVFDGSEDESYTRYVGSSGKISYYNHNYMTDGKKYGSSFIRGICNRIVSNSGILDNEYITHSATDVGVQFYDAIGKWGLENDTPDGFKAILAEKPIIIEYELATPTFEPFTDQTPFYGLKSYDTVTYISTDSKVEPSIEAKYAKTEGDAINLGNYNRTKLNEIHISELMALQTELATALVAGSEG